VTSSEQAGTAGESGIHLEVSVGTEAFEPGRTEVILESTGRVQVLSELEGREARRAEVSLDSGYARAMIQGADESVRRTRQGKRYGLPDEPRYHFEVRGREQHQSFDVWRSELPDHPELNRIIQVLQRTLDEQFDGEIIL